MLLAFFGLALASSMALDRGVFARRAWVDHADLGRWREAQWLARLEVLREGGRRPDVIFTGDSAVGYGLQPALAGTHGFNLARPGLGCEELDQLTPRLERLVPGKPRALVLGLLWYEFFPGEPELAFAQGHPPSWARIAGGFYEEPNLSQKRVYPGSRVARYWADLRLPAAEGKRSSRARTVDGDGHAVSQSSDIGSRLPPSVPETRPGWFRPDLVEPLARFRLHWEARGVPVVFVFMPLHPGLKAELLNRTGADHAAWKAAVVGAMAGHVIDAEDRLQDPRMFRDGVHLNGAGAKRLSAVMREELQQLGWADHPPSSRLDSSAPRSLRPSTTR